jgi:hypothetical protein
MPQKLEVSFQIINKNYDFEPQNSIVEIVLE